MQTTNTIARGRLFHTVSKQLEVDNKKASEINGVSTFLASVIDRLEEQGKYPGLDPEERIALITAASFVDTIRVALS